MGISFQQGMCVNRVRCIKDETLILLSKSIIHQEDGTVYAQKEKDGTA